MCRPNLVLAAAALMLTLLIQPLSAEELYQPCIACHGDAGQGSVVSGSLNETITRYLQMLIAFQMCFAEPKQMRNG